MAGPRQATESPCSAVGRAVEEIVQQMGEGVLKLEPKQEDDEDDADDWAQDEEAYDAAIRKIELESIDLTQDDDGGGGGDAAARTRPAPGGGADEARRCAHSAKGIRNPCLCGSHERVAAVHCRGAGGAEVRVGSVHALVGGSDCLVGRYVVDFVAVRQLWRHRTSGAVVVRGAAYTRSRNLDGLLKAYKSEVCRVMEVDTNDPRPEEEQALVELALEQLRPQARTLHLTNKPFPECRFDEQAFATPQDKEDRAPLTCRWVLGMMYPDQRYRRAQRATDGEFIAHLTESQVPKARHRMRDADRLYAWREVETSKGGSYVAPTSEPTGSRATGKKPAAPRRRYTAADMFSGAGGYTTGAKSAGIRVEHAVDHWPRANATYRANHPEVALYEQDITAHCSDPAAPRARVDLMHLSPPCQFFSPAHTVAGRHDGANAAALAACRLAVLRLRPRVFTLEQTFGLVQERHRPRFTALLRSLTRAGCSLRWRVLALVAFGLPQTRRRLLLIGAAPGEPLPPLPAPTHADADAAPAAPAARRCKHFVSARRACGGLVAGASALHDPAAVRQTARAQWDGSRPMHRTITTSGGQAYHWEGQRDLTLAEFARLQGFPEDYVFKPPCIKKQIGNAFPPIVVQAITKQLVCHLAKIDGVKSGPDEEDIIIISDDDDDDDDGDNSDSGGYDHSGGGHSGDHCKHEPVPKAEFWGSSDHLEDVQPGFACHQTLTSHESRKYHEAQLQGVDVIALDGPDSHFGHPSHDGYTWTAAGMGKERIAPKRSYNGAADDAENGSSPKRSRTA